MVGKNKVRLLVLVLLFGTIGFYGDIGYASEAKKPLFSGYPTEFSGVGRVDRVGSVEIVIDDHLYTFSNRLVAHTPTSKRVGLSAFREGDTVGFITEFERVIQSLWLIKSGGTIASQPISSGKDQQKLYNENGVWRN